MQQLGDSAFVWVPKSCSITTQWWENRHYSRKKVSFLAKMYNLKVPQFRNMPLIERSHIYERVQLVVYYQNKHTWIIYGIRTSRDEVSGVAYYNNYDNVILILNILQMVKRFQFILFIQSHSWYFVNIVGFLEIFFIRWVNFALSNGIQITRVVSSE